MSELVRASWLGRIMAQARMRNLQSPLVWTTAASFDAVLEDKLRDLVTLAPSTWDAVVRDLVRITRMMHTSTGTLGDIKATLARCYAIVRGPRRSGGLGDERDACPLLSEYRPALLHVLDATFVMVACVWERKNLDAMPAVEHIVKFDELDKPCQAAIWAIRSQVKLTCFLGLSAEAGGTPAEGSPASAGRGASNAVFRDAVMYASTARSLYPAEGQWKAMYGDLLPHDNPRKLTLLRNAVRARRTPFTLTCLSKYLYKLGDSKAFDLCADALLEWPRSVHANVSYVIMFLSCTVPGKLSRCLAEQCLLRLQRLAPSCVFVQGLALELRLVTAGSVASVTPPASPASPASPDAGGDRHRGHDSEDREDSGDAGLRPVRPRPFEPTDHRAIHKALSLYCRPGRPDGPWSMVNREDTGRLLLDECNCVCSGDCALLTFKAHGTLKPDKPRACYAE